MSESQSASSEEDNERGSASRLASKRLYQDVLTLFSIQDGEGALISLERLLNIGNLDDEIEDFLRLNGHKLVALYENVLGPFTKIVRHGSVAIDEMPKGYLDRGLLRDVFERVNGQKSIDELLDGLTEERLKACAALEQLHRARLIDF